LLLVSVPFASLVSSSQRVIGGGAHKFGELFSSELGMEVSPEDEMDCLITGLKFISQIPDEVYYFSDELIHRVTHTRPSERDQEEGEKQEGGLTKNESNQPNGSPPAPTKGEHRTTESTSTSKLQESSTQSSSQPQPSASTSSQPPSCSFLPPPQPATSLERPSPTPPQYKVSFAPPSAQLPCLLVNIGSGVSIIHVKEDGSFERVSGTSLGGGTLWGLLSLLTGASGFDGTLSSSA
jgi:type II pantothenate kinase